MAIIRPTPPVKIEDADMPAEELVEEYFNSLEAVNIKERYYPDLPISYRPGTEEKHCGNYRAFDTVRSFCLHWLRPVRADYVCNAWAPI